MMTNGPAATPVVKPRRRWLTVLAMVLIFVSGVVIGGAGTIVVGVNRLKYAAQHPEEAPRRIAQRLQRRLKLTVEQVRKVEGILQQRQARLMTIRKEVQPRVMAEVDEGSEQISAVLDEGQRAKWVALCEELKREWMPGAGSRGEDHGN